MTTLRASGWLIIISTIVIAAILTLLPLPLWAEAFRPIWLLLVVLFWAINLPYRVNLGIAWCCGLLLDVINGTLLGENALIFVTLAYIAIKIHRQIRVFSLPGQAGVIFLLLLFNQALLFWLQGLQGIGVSLKWFWGSPFVSALLWPWIAMVLADCMKRFRIN